MKLSIGMLLGSVVVLLALTAYQGGVITRQSEAIDSMERAPCGFKFKPVEPVRPVRPTTPTARYAPRAVRGT